MRGTEDLSQTCLVLRDPVCRRQGPRGFVQAFVWDVFISYDCNHASEQTLEDVEDVSDWSAVAKGGECRTMKYHLPLDSALGGKEGGGVNWNFYAQGGGTWESTGGLERTWALDAKEHTRVGGGNIAPTVFFDEVRLEPEQPPVGTVVGGPEGICAGERDASPGSPVVHSLYTAGKVNYGGRGIGHDGGGGEMEGEGKETRGERFGKNEGT